MYWVMGLWVEEVEGVEGVEGSFERLREVERG
jgi:hypothetical protein